MFQRCAKLVFVGLMVSCVFAVSDAYARGRSHRAKSVYVVGPRASTEGQSFGAKRGQRMRRDANGDGVCHMRGRGDQRFVDADGDGVCDRFVDADGDGINDNSPLAGLDLTNDQKAAIAEIRASGTGPHRDAVLEILTEEQRARFERNHDLDFAYEVKGVARFRVNYFMQQNGIGAAFRLIPSVVWTLEECGAKESLHYANARYLCFYLQQRGLLRKFYKTFRDAHRAGKDKTGWASFTQVVGGPQSAAEFEKAWHAWVKTLKWPPR